jgi:hypothetical protein
LRLESLAHFGISFWRIALLGLAISASVATIVGFIAGGVLGVAKVPFLLIASSVSFYVVVSTPRRMLDRRRVSQSRDSIMLAAAMKATMGIVGSRCRILALIRPRDASLAIAVRDALRKVLLGHSVRDSVESSAGQVVSYSAAAVLRGVATLGAESVSTGDEETRGLSASSDLMRETKLPMFMTACFFTPIMLVLYAVFSQIRDPASLAALITLEFTVIDLAFYLTSSDRGIR